MTDHETIAAWQEAFCQRTCPPANILYGNDMNAEHHIRTCFFCRERLRENTSDWSSLARKIKEYFPLPEKPKRPVPGQVWTVSEQLVGWQEGQYFNPPQI